MSGPSIAELRAATQPASIFERNSGEHWAGRLYVRRFSPYLTRLFIKTPITPNGVTWLFILSGVAAAAVLAIDSVWAAVGAVLLIQLQILLDCSDGELARWRGQSSPVGIYLDRFGHWVTEAALPIALGIRVDEPVLGLVVAVLVLFVKGETALVHVARTEAGLGKVEDTVATAAPRGGLLATLRRTAGRLPFYRAFVAIEFTALALLFAILDEERTLLVALVPVAAVTAVGHLLAILTSKRLR
ncbi:MAG: CDP-alcohol phosphatidyltransferase family protein [Actinomycetota bacterium]|nr:CDP-alcohol phosphatidyltransferase family protein [Actinomycetota bacterium]MDQ5807677.1 CDP-alcohol phosphatidyltransferase family protein [Actinomycetota bacterium]